ncbi:MAG: J domain-containing protein [Alphaproteobacteria bacterium]
MSRRNRRTIETVFDGDEPPRRRCEHPGCAEDGIFPAPRSRDQLRDYVWFCLDHVRAYNAAWDYYRDCSTSEIEASLREDTVWQRPTWPLGSMGATPGGARPWKFRHNDNIKGFSWFFGEDEEPVGMGSAQSKLSHGEIAALRELDLKPPVTLVALKNRWRELVKRHHPDANGGDPAAEERIKRINHAYSTLKQTLASHASRA